MLKLKHGQWIELNRIDSWLDRPVSWAEKVMLWVIVAIVAVSIASMIAKWI
jgi:hypothetical protein